MIKEGWNIVAAEPIEEITVLVVGRRFYLEKKGV